MFFNHNNDIDDDDYNEVLEKKTFDISKYTIPLIIFGGVLIVVIIIAIVASLFKEEEIVYEEKLYYITLLGETDMTLYLHENYNEPGYSGKDDSGADLTNEIAVSSNVNSNVVGSYKVSYTLGNITKERNVRVIEKPVGATYIHLLGDKNMFLYIGQEYIEPGYKVIDSIDGDKLNDKVKVASNVDTSKEGIYKVVYWVINSDGITTSQERTVVVMDRSISLIPVDTDMINGNVTINIYIKDELFDYLILPNNIKVTERTSTYQVSNNGEYKFVMYNTEGAYFEKIITINNIDREAPSGSCSGSYQEGTSQINISATDNVGISKYVINDVTYTTNVIKLDKEVDSVNITIYDKAGNTKGISCKLENKNIPRGKNGKVLLNVAAGTNERSDYDSEMRYVEVMPSDATVDMPLVIYLDGAWSYASFPGNVLSRSITTYVQSGNAYNEVGENFLFVSPRYVISRGANGGLNWCGDQGAREAGKIKRLIDHLYKKYQIDMNRIYITGVSLGGDGVWYMINEYPNLFAAGTAVSGCPLCTSVSNFTTTPVLGYNGTGQTERNATYTTCVPNMINSIQRVGGTAESRVKSGWDHGKMIDVYSTDKNVFKWMFNYKRG